jgi:hypothetical protein
MFSRSLHVRKETDVGLWVLSATAEIQFMPAFNAPKFVSVTILGSFVQPLVLSGAKFRAKSGSSLRKACTALHTLCFVPAVLRPFHREDQPRFSTHLCAG